jgi:ATP-dependent Clp protease protease subunit
MKDKLNQLLAKHSNRKKEEIEKDSDRDNWMSAEEAKKYGLIDLVLKK